jgi:glucokinase
MINQSIIGVDLGGTKINIGKIVNGKIAEEVRLPTGAQRSEDEIILDIIHGIEQIIDKKTTIGIGIGVPGLVDEKNGLVLNVLNIPSWKEVPLKSRIEKNFKIKVQISNDANCFAIGEKIYGIGQNYHNLVCLTLGTGVGAGIIINNKLYTGTLSMAGEFGGINYLKDTYEYYCSGKFFTDKHDISAKALNEKALSGDVQAIHIFDEFGEHVGNLIKTILFTFAPEAIILGGSISKAFRFFQKSMMDSVNQFPYKRILEDLVIEVCSHDKIPVLGAAALIIAYETQSSEKLHNQII